MSFKSSLIQIPRVVWALGIVTLLINLSSIVIVSLSPLYMTQVFGLTIIHLGLLEGATEFVSWFTRVFSGVLSDFMHKRKPLLVIAYTITALSRPIFALAPSIGWMYAARITDRISNGLQATPREALIGDVAPTDLKGACYGLRQTLSVIGSLIGALGVMLLMRRTDNNYKFIFWLASIPPLMALIILFVFVKDKPNKKEILKKDPARTMLISSGDSAKINWSIKFLEQIKKISQLDHAYWIVVFISGIFMISNYSATYLILQAEHLGLSQSDVPIVMIIQNFFSMIAAFPIGRLSDRIDRRYLLAIGFILTIFSNLFIGCGHSIIYVFLGAALWGIQIGINQSILLTKVADTTHRDLRGTGFGIYYIAIGTALFISNSITGYLFTKYGPFYAFMGSNFVACIALLLLPFMKSTSR